MKNIKPLVTENPQGNYQLLHNMTIIKNKEVYLRDFNGEGDLNLVDYCKRECKEQCDIEQEGTAEDFAENMECDCPVSLFYHMAVGHAELRERLKFYEEAFPDMYEALKECMALFALGANAVSKKGINFEEKRDKARDIERKVLNAIAKAEGESHE